MVRRQHKFLCIVLCLMLALSAVLVGTMSAGAASGDTIYVKVNNGWSNLHCYMWNGQGETKNHDWPGVSMTAVSGTENVYSYTMDGSYEKVIFNNGNSGNGNQTTDLSNPGANKIYDLKEGEWSDYLDAPTNPTTPTDPTTTTQAPTTVPSGSITVYFRNTDNWTTPACYMWNGDGETQNHEWPGIVMTHVEDNVWSYSTSTVYANCIFNNNNQGKQTANLVVQNGKLYDYSKNAWEDYDVSDLQISSFTADPASDIYIGSTVTLSAAASNKNGAAVTYQFSVTNASGGTSVISAFSSKKSVTWTPAAEGNYTITCDFKDTEGNELSRTLTLSVQDASALVKPVIMNVTPANLKLIKVNNAATVSVQAGGGHTGTNLLFYKYIVTDPNGVQNTPYYTLNSTYSFTPDMEGKYTVNVYVQNSDNNTINKTYTYTATNGSIEDPTDPTDPVQPTTAPATTVQPTTAGADVLLGDANNDGEVNIIDATHIQKYAAEYDNITIEVFAAADMNKDGFITVTDATLIQRLLVDL